MAGRLQASKPPWEEVEQVGRGKQEMAGEATHKWKRPKGGGQGSQESPRALSQKARPTPLQSTAWAGFRVLGVLCGWHCRLRTQQSPAHPPSTLNPSVPLSPHVLCSGAGPTLVSGGPTWSLGSCLHLSLSWHILEWAGEGQGGGRRGLLSASGETFLPFWKFLKVFSPQPAGGR